jgi:hypothetical protein
MSNFLDKLSRKDSILIELATVGVALIGIVNLYAAYNNYIWKPTVVVNDVDYENAIAHLTINGKPFVLNGDGIYHIKFEWGISFGTTRQKSGVQNYDRIQLLKNRMVQTIVDKKN